jgi:hypothetical protein
MAIAAAELALSCVEDPADADAVIVVCVAPFAHVGNAGRVGEAPRARRMAGTASAFCHRSLLLFFFSVVSFSFFFCSVSALVQFFRLAPRITPF